MATFDLHAMGAFEPDLDQAGFEDRMREVMQWVREAGQQHGHIKVEIIITKVDDFKQTGGE